MLGRRIRPHHWDRAAARDRSHIHDAAARLPQQGKQRLSDGDLPDHVDFQLPAQLVQWNELERTSYRNPGVVDQSVKSALAYVMPDSLSDRCDRCAIGDIQLDGNDACPGICLERVTGLEGPNPRKYGHPLLRTS